MRVIWTKLASRHLEGIRSYTGWSSPTYANRIVARIVRAAIVLSKSSMPGNEVPEYGDPAIREVFVHPYRVIFKLTAAEYAVLAVYHASREIPDSPPEN